MKTSSKISVVGMLLVSLVGCASGAAKPSQSGDGTDVDRKNPTDFDGKSCDDLAASPRERGTINSATRDEQVGSWVVEDASGSRLLNLCKALKDSGKKVAIFQFAGAKCESCIKESKEFEKKIAASSKGDEILHVIVFTDRRREFQERDFTEFMDAHAPNSLRLHDEDGLIWKAVNRRPSTPDRGVIAALGMSGRDAFSNVEGRVLDIFDDAEQLVD